MKSEQRFYSMDGMRGCAAILVLVYHIGLREGLPILPVGYLAVDFFFALSGFVIALAYEDRLKAGLGIRDFLAIRLIRLYPLFLLGILFGVVKAIAQIAVHDPAALSVPALLLSLCTSLVMLPSNIPGFAGLFPPDLTIVPLNTPAWSLFFEMLVNICFALWFFRLSNRGLATAMCAAGIVLALGITLLGNAILGVTAGSILWGFPRVFLSFFAGVLLFRLGEGRRRRETHLAHLPNIALISILLVVPPAGTLIAFEIGAIYMAFPALIWLAASWEVPQKYKAVYGVLGLISYPLYIVHFPLLMICLAMGEKFGIASRWVYSASVIGLLILSYGILKLYDEPIRRLISGRSRHQGRNTPSTIAKEPA
jgi:peptidoglycan/LPS O-acetylase OafA/YrhL